MLDTIIDWILSAMNFMITTPGVGLILLLAGLAIAWVLYVTIPVRMARKRNRNAVIWVLVSLLVSPLVSYILLAIIGKKKD
ncbi:MAG: hypothetical protein KBS77_00430 [Bacteroidales bacterium]|nr:hypothetical protein [Candidatus Colicola faecequi]